MKKCWFISAAGPRNVFTYHWCKVICRYYLIMEISPVNNVHTCPKTRGEYCRSYLGAWWNETFWLHTLRKFAPWFANPSWISDPTSEQRYYIRWKPSWGELSVGYRENTNKPKKAILEKIEPCRVVTLFWRDMGPRADEEHFIHLR